MERDPRDAASRPAGALPFQREEQHGPLIFPRQAGGYNPEHSSMPAFRRFDDHSIPLRFEGGGDLLARLREDLSFDRLALRVGERQLVRDRAGLFCVPLLEEREGTLGRVDASGRVQTGSEPERDLFGRGRASRLDPAFGEQGPQPGRTRRGERAQARGNQNAVFPGQGNEIGDRSQAGDPQKRFDG